MKDPWRGVAFGLAIVLLVAVGLAVAMALAPGSPPASSPPSPTVPGVVPTSSPDGSAATPTSAPSDEPSASISPPSPGPSASGTAQATATIRGLTIDGADDPEGRDRKITFGTNDPTTIRMRVATVSSTGTVDACLAVNGVELYCTSGRTFTMTGQTSRSNATWALTLRGQGVETPVLDVTLEFPAAAPTVTIDGAWFDGAARPDYNGVVIELMPREPLVSVSATWEGSHAYRLTVREQGAGVLEFEGTASAMAQDVLVGDAIQRIELVNTGAGAERVPFTATIVWR